MFRYSVADILGQIARFPVHLQLWLAWLVLVDFVLVAVFLRHREARVVALWQLANLVVISSLWSCLGPVRLLGLSHVLFWTPLTGFMARQLRGIPAATLYGAWARTLVATNVVSLVLDAADVVRYVLGDRQPIV